MLQSNAASFVVMGRQARKEQKRKFLAYLPDQNLHLYPSQKRCRFYHFSFPATLLQVDTIRGKKRVYVCLFICFIFQLITRGIQNTGNTGNFKSLSQWQKLEIKKSSRSKEAALVRVEEFYLMSKAACRCRLRAQWELHDLQPVGICRQTGSKWIVYKCLLRCWLAFH